LDPIVYWGIEGVTNNQNNCTSNPSAGDQVAHSKPLKQKYIRPGVSRTELVFIGNTSEKSKYAEYTCLLDDRQMIQLKNLDSKNKEKLKKMNLQWAKYSCLTKENGPRCYNGQLDKKIWKVPKSMKEAENLNWPIQARKQSFEDCQRNLNEFVSGCKNRKLPLFELSEAEDYGRGPKSKQVLYCSEVEDLLTVSIESHCRRFTCAGTSPPSDCMEICKKTPYVSGTKFRNIDGELFRLQDQIVIKTSGDRFLGKKAREFYSLSDTNKLKELCWDNSEP
jgi:hypothetical protein